MESTIAVRIEKKKLLDLKAVSKEENKKNSEVLREVLDLGLKEKKITLAIDKYRKREISIGKAAEIADVSISRLMDILRERNVPFNYGAKELMEDFEGFI